MSALFYAYAKNSRDDHTWRYLMVFASRDTADEWYRAVTDSVASGYTKFSGVRRLTPQFYVHDPNVGNIHQTINDAKCAANFLDRMFFTLLHDRDSRVLSTLPFPSGQYTDHISGGQYFIRSALEPSLFWFYDEDSKKMLASDKQRTRFTIRIADERRPQGTVIIGTDEIRLTVHRPNIIKPGHYYTNILSQNPHTDHGVNVARTVVHSPFGERWELV
ncbi:hypothetical protein CPB86DRAFT_717011 [Serendipita vermifera]|nr:hypothetical protein CPB86DRAFT_717011 [Serendipita vermifera]